MAMIGFLKSWLKVMMMFLVAAIAVLVFCCFAMVVFLSSFVSFWIPSILVFLFFTASVAVFECGIIDKWFEKEWL